MKKKKTSIILVILVLLGFFSAFPTIESADVEVVIWFFADSHVGDDIGDSEYKVEFWDAVNDTNGMSGADEVDYAFGVGDMISGDSHNNNWDDFKDVWDDLIVTTYKNITVGNHDSDWNSNTNSPRYISTLSQNGRLWYSYDIGNIRLLIGGDEETYWDVEQGYGQCFMYGGAQRSWYNTSIRNAHDNNLNSWIVFHQPLNDTTDRSDEHAYWTMVEVNGSYDGAPLFNQMMSYLEGESKSPNLYIAGHTHNSCTENTSSEILFMEKYSCNHLQIGSMTGGSGLPVGHSPSSRYVYLTVGSSTVTVKSYNHTNNSFNPSKEFTFDLDYAFDVDFPSSLAPQLTSIGYRTDNGTIWITDTTPTLNWTKADNSFFYNVVIANDSGFVDVYREIDNINAVNYPVEYSENATHVSFDVPGAYALVNGTYYFRVRVKGWS